MNRFFGKSDNIYEDHIIIDGGDVNHIKNVLRMKIGEELMVSGGNNMEYLCRIEEIEDALVKLDIIEARPSETELPAKIYLFQGLPKADKMELIIQKCVELGVHEIIPVEMKRSVVKLDAKKADAKIARWQKVSESAAKQSGRGNIPNICSMMSYDKAIAYAQDMDIILLPYELAEGMEATKEALAQIKPGMSIGIFIGPEGGFEVSEVEKAMAQDAKVISLGKRILRTETAGLAVMSILMYHLETEV